MRASFCIPALFAVLSLASPALAAPLDGDALNASGGEVVFGEGTLDHFSFELVNLGGGTLEITSSELRILTSPVATTPSWLFTGGAISVPAGDTFVAQETLLFDGGVIGGGTSYFVSLLITVTGGDVHVFGSEPFGSPGFVIGGGSVLLVGELLTYGFEIGSGDLTILPSSTVTSAVPAPLPLALLATGALALGVAGRRRRA